MSAPAQLPAELNLKAYLRQAIEVAANALMHAEVDVLLQAAHYERNGTRRAYRNGYRTRRWHTEAGVVLLHIPKLRSGSYYPAFLEDESHAKALLASLARQALTGGVPAEAVRELLTEDNPGVATALTDTLTQQASDYLRRPLRYPYRTLTARQDGEWLFICGTRRAGTLHLLDVCRVEESPAYWRAVVDRLAERGLEVAHIEAAELPITARRAVSERYPQAHMLLPAPTLALGEPLTALSIEPRGPYGLLTLPTDAALRVIVSDEGLVQVRRAMRNPADAVSSVRLEVAA